MPHFCQCICYFPGETLAGTLEATEEDVQRAVAAAEGAHKKWSALSNFDRAKFLYR